MKGYSFTPNILSVSTYVCCHHDIGILETFFVLYNKHSKTHLDIIHSTALQLYDPVFFTKLYKYV